MARNEKAVVIGSGPNGLTAAIVLAQAGLNTTLVEAEASVGGGARTAELTLPGFLHDVCSAVHPMAAASPAFQSFPLAQHGLEWIHPPLPFAHPLDDGTAAVLPKPLDAACERLGSDGAAYRRAMEPLVRRWPDLAGEILRPMLHVPKAPFLLARFGWMSVWPAAVSARRVFQTTAGRALFAGVAAHSILPLEAYISASFGWVLSALAHAVGWPVPKGGSQRISDALARYFQSLGGRILTSTRVGSLDEVESNGPVLCDLTPRQFANIAGKRLPQAFRQTLERYRYGPGVFKMDWALDAPIPWVARECAAAATVHLGGTLEEIAASERAPWRGATAEKPFVLLVQPSLFDSTRAPAGKHTAWAYCHVPNGSPVDMTDRIEAQVERFAPGFRKTILARHSFTPAEMEAHNANLVGGDITGGAQDIMQLIFRPTRMLYRTPLRGIYLCSSSTPPGGAVHGMCGWNAAHLALRDMGI